MTIRAFRRFETGECAGSAETPRTAKVVGILRAYNAAMAKAGRPYRYT